MKKKKWIEAWRLFEVTPDSGPKTLFHGYKGSRTLQLDTPLLAKQGLVSNPGKKHYRFRAGWHVTLSENDAIKYLTRFSNNRDLRVCKVLVKDIRPKPRSNAPVYLAKHMMVKTKDWISIQK